MNGKIKPAARTQRQKGFTLIEILIALSISFVLLGGVLKVFASSKQTYRVQEAMSRLQENGRFAMGFISKDIRISDFWSCVGNLGLIVNNLDPAGAGYIDFVNTPSINGTDGAAGAPDTITLRGAIGGGSAVLAAFGPLASAPITIPAGHPFQQGGLALVSDCVSGDIFEISAAGATQLSHAVAGGTPGNVNAGLQKVYLGDATVHRLQEVAYSIQPGASGQPALFRNTNQAGAVELVEGVEDMQVLYGQDIDGDGWPNSYVNAGAVANMANVVSIRVVFTLRTLDDNITLQAGGADNRLRRNFTSTVAIRNRLP